MRAYIIAFADCSDQALKNVGWTPGLECKAWHLELSIKVLLLYGPMRYAWPCENSLADWRRGQYEYEIRMLMDWSWPLKI